MTDEERAKLRKEIHDKIFLTVMCTSLNIIPMALDGLTDWILAQIDKGSGDS